MNRGKKVLSLFLACALVISGIAFAPKKVKAAEDDVDYGIQSPRVAFNYRDTVTLGSYWQEDTNGDGVADESDDKQPIVWRILKEFDDGTALVVSDKILDYGLYNDWYDLPHGGSSAACEWSSSDMRAWLNSYFYAEAFSTDDKTAIKKSKIKNKKNPENSPYGGTDTEDNVFLLSLDEIVNTDYGFADSMYKSDQERVAKITSYARNNGKGNIDTTTQYWLRTLSVRTDDRTMYIDCAGRAPTNGTYHPTEGGIRPAMIIDLSSQYVKEGEKVKASIKGVEWDIVTFGTYDGDPINWRVLYVNGDDAFLVSNEFLADTKKPYNKQYDPVTWKDCTLRSWLNVEFYNGSFNSDEKTMIKTTNVINDDNSVTGITGGDDTEDNVFLLSLDEARQLKYGFCELCYVWSDTRYVEEKSGVNGNWWLRSPGKEEDKAVYVERDGSIVDGGNGVIWEIACIRPALHIDLSSSAWTKGEAVSIGDPTGGTVVVDPSESTVINPDPTEETPAEETPAEETPSGETPGEDVAPAPETAPAPPTVVAPKPPVNNAPPKAENEEVTSDQSEATPAPAEVKDNKTTFSIKNKAKVKKSSKIKIKDKDKIAKITLNGKKIRIKADKKSFTLKLKSYKKILKKKGKWNKLVVTDANGNKTTIKFKTK